MGKQNVDRAVELAKTGKWKSAHDSVKSEQRQFLEKRLAYHEAELRLDPQVARHLLDGTTPEEAVEPASASAQRNVQRTVPASQPFMLPEKMTLAEPDETLALLSKTAPRDYDISRTKLAEIWTLVGLATLARTQQPNAAQVYGIDQSNAGRFAYAVGFRDVIREARALEPGEPGRTQPLERVSSLMSYERQASAIAGLLIPASRTEHEEARKTFRYVITELLRNVLQHSRDPLGGVVAAQVMDPLGGAPKSVQVAVGDAGVGIPAALQASHPTYIDPEAALDKALHPHISGTFREGLTGSAYNAGMGLFFISEMAKLTEGRLLIATRGAGMVLSGNLELEEMQQKIRLLAGFPGTLVAFELPLSHVADHDSLIETIRKRAEERTPKRNTVRFLVFGPPPEGVPTFLVHHIAENTVEAEKLSRETLVPIIFERNSIALDFRGLSIATQSFIHSLLYEPLRLAWALRIPIYAIETAPAVRSALELVENYALGG